MAVKFELKGTREVQQLIAGIRKPMANAEKVNAKIATQLYGYVMNVFAAEGAFDGRARWAPLKAGGRYSGGKFRTAYKLLQDTGQLRQSYERLFSATEAGVGALASRPHGDLAPIHEYGNPSRNLPARPMLPSVDVLKATTLQIYGLEFERGGIRGVGR